MQPKLFLVLKAMDNMYTRPDGFHTYFHTLFRVIPWDQTSD